MPTNQELFGLFFEDYQKDILRIVETPASLDEFVSKCNVESGQIREEDPVVASEYLFCASISCLCRLLDYEYDDNICNVGQSLMSEACTLLPGDREYELYRLLFSVFDINPKDGKTAYLRLKDIYKECPSFRLLDKNLLSAEWAEDRFNQTFSIYLAPVVDNMMLTADTESCLEACTLLASMPPTQCKLKAYAYMSRILSEQGKSEEALRTAKLGVELLGSGHVFDHTDENSCLWAECWTRVATCNRQKKEYDFAMSLYEKGASNGIPQCIQLLGEMYEKGESEDPDPKKATELYAKAQSLQAEFDREEREEAERIERERQEAEAKHLQELERQRLDEERIAHEKELAQLKEQKESKRVSLYVVIGILFITSLMGVISLCSKEPVDTLYKYVSQQQAVIDYQLAGDAPYIIVMTSTGLYYDSLDGSVSRITPVGSKMDVSTVGVYPSEKGARISFFDSGRKLSISTSKELKVKKIAKDSYIVSTVGTQLADGTIENAYVVFNDSDALKVIYIQRGVLEGNILHQSIDGDWMRYLPDDVVGAFTNEEKNRIRSKGISEYKSEVSMNLTNLDCSLMGKISFPSLKRCYSATEFTEGNVNKDFADDARTLLAGKLTDNILSHLVDMKRAKTIYHSTQTGKTFAVVEDHHDSEEIFSLYMIDNSSMSKRFIDQAKSVSFEKGGIHLIKEGTFLLIFSMDKHVYYNYYGVSQ